MRSHSAFTKRLDTKKKGVSSMHQLVILTALTATRVYLEATAKVGAASAPLELVCTEDGLCLAVRSHLPSRLRAGLHNVPHGCSGSGSRRSPGSRRSSGSRRSPGS